VSTKCTVMQPGKGPRIENCSGNRRRQTYLFWHLTFLLANRLLSLSSLRQGLATEIIILVNPPKSFDGTSPPQPPVDLSSFFLAISSAAPATFEWSRMGTNHIKEQSPGSRGWCICIHECQQVIKKQEISTKSRAQKFAPFDRDKAWDQDFEAERRDCKTLTDFFILFIYYFIIWF